MTYSVKEIFYTLQGEGGQAGRAAVFCRFAGCNLWSGREVDRVKAVCQFCDTDFVGTDGDGGGSSIPRKTLLRRLTECGPATGPVRIIRTGNLSSSPEENRFCNWTHLFWRRSRPLAFRSLSRQTEQ